MFEKEKVDARIKYTREWTFEALTKLLEIKKDFYKNNSIQEIEYCEFNLRALRNSLNLYNVEIPKYYFVEGSYFYNQLVTTNAKQICPAGYRLPTYADINSQTLPIYSIVDDAFNLNYTGWLSVDGLFDYNHVGHYWLLNSNYRTYRWQDEVLQADYNQSQVGACIRCVKE